MADNKALTQGLGVLGGTDEARQRAERISERFAPIRQGIGQGVESIQRSMSMGPVLGIMDQLSRLGAPIVGGAYEAASPIASALGFEEAGADYDIMGDDLRGMFLESNPVISRMETIAGAAAPEKIDPFQMPPEVGMSGSGMTDGRRYSGRGMKVEGTTERQDYADAQAAETERDVQKALSGKMDAEQSAGAIQNAFVSAMKEFGQASGKPADTAEMSQEDLLEKYKQEFAEATGVDISGKPDKSAALMAFGLALMQNRAGKGFNVGRILRSVGEAGEKALPELKAAKSEAKAAQLAAGKYALGRLQAGRDARSALQLEQLKFAQEAMLKQMEIDAKAAEKAAEGPEIKNTTDIEVIPNLKIRRGTSSGNGIFVDATQAATQLAKGYGSAYNALDSIGQMEQAVTDYANSPSPTISMLTDRLNTVLAGAGLKDPKVSFGSEGLSPESKRTALKDSLLTEFKRMLTQETGNGISNVDLERIDAAFGNLDLFGNPQEALFRLSQMKAIFTGKVKALDNYIDLTMEPDQFATPQEYQRAQKILNERIGVRGGFKVNTEGGSATIDLTQ
jgi:hypothetical protein